MGNFLTSHLPERRGLRTGIALALAGFALTTAGCGSEREESTPFKAGSPVVMPGDRGYLEAIGFRNVSEPNPVSDPSGHKLAAQKYSTTIPAGTEVRASLESNPLSISTGALTDDCETTITFENNGKYTIDLPASITGTPELKITLGKSARASDAAAALAQAGICEAEFRPTFTAP